MGLMRSAVALLGAVGLAAGTCGTASAVTWFAGEVNATTCQVVLTNRDLAPSAIVTVRFGNARSYTVDGTEGAADGVWRHTIERQPTTLGQTSLTFTVSQGGSQIADDATPLPSTCMTPGLFPPSGTAPAASGQLGDSSGTTAADLWTLDGKGALRYYQWTPRTDPGPWLVPELVGAGLRDIAGMAVIPDRTGDRRSDLLVRHRSDGSLWVYANLGNGALRRHHQVGWHWGGMDQVFFAGAMVSGSATQYVVARRTDGTLWRYPLTATGVGSGTQVGHGWNAMRFMFSTGSMWGDGAWDVVGIATDGTMYGYRSSRGVLASVGQVGHGWQGFEMVGVTGDTNSDGRPDLMAVQSNHVMRLYQARAGYYTLLDQEFYAATDGSADTSVPPETPIVALA